MTCLTNILTLGTCGETGLNEDILHEFTGFPVVNKL